MSQNEKKGTRRKATRPKKWCGARRPAGPATTALSFPAGGHKAQKHDKHKTYKTQIIHKRSIKSFKFECWERSGSLVSA